MIPSANNPTASDASRPATRSHEFVAALARAYTLSEIFPLHHPTVQDAVREMLERLPDLEDTAVGVARSGFTQDDQPLEDPHGHVREFARDLSMAGVTELALVVPLEREQLERLLMGLRVVTEDPSIGLEDFLAREGGCAIELGFHGSPRAAVDSLMERTEWPVHEATAVENTAVENTAVENTAVENTAVEDTAAENTVVEDTVVENTAVETAEAKDATDGSNGVRQDSEGLDATVDALALPEWSVEDEVEAEARYAISFDDSVAASASFTGENEPRAAETPDGSGSLDPDESAEATPGTDWQSEVRARLLMASAIESPESLDQGATESGGAVESHDTHASDGEVEAELEAELGQRWEVKTPFEPAAQTEVEAPAGEEQADIDAGVPSINVPALKLPTSGELPDVEDELAAAEPGTFDAAESFEVADPFEENAARDALEEVYADSDPDVVEFPLTNGDPEWANAELHDEAAYEPVGAEPPIEGSLDEDQSFALAAEWGADIQPEESDLAKDGAVASEAASDTVVAEDGAVEHDPAEEDWGEAVAAASAFSESDSSESDSIPAHLDEASTDDFESLDPSMAYDHPVPVTDALAPEFEAPLIDSTVLDTNGAQPLVPTLDESEYELPAAVVPPDTHLAAADNSSAPVDDRMSSAPAAQLEQVQAFRAALRDDSETDGEVEVEPEPIEDLWEPDGESALATLWDAETASWVEGPASPANDDEEEPYPAVEALAPDGPSLVDPETEALENELAAEAAAELPYLSFPDDGDAEPAPTAEARLGAGVEGSAGAAASEIEPEIGIDIGAGTDAGPGFSELAASFLRAQEVERPSLRRQIEDRAAALDARGEHDLIATGVEALVRDAVPGDIPAIELGRSLASDDVQAELCSRLADVRDPDRRDELVYVFSQLSSIMAARLAHELSEVPPRAARRNYMDALFRMRTDALTAAIPMLEDSRWFIVRNGVDILGEAGDERSVARLAPSLAHPDHRVRRATVMALAKLGGDRAGIELLPVLDDPSAEVREGAAMAVGHLRVAKAQRPLLALLDRDKDDEAQMVILRSLGQLGDPGAVPAIEKRAVGFFFKKPSKAVRIAAYRALAAIGSPHARRLVSDAVADRDAEVSTAARALVGQFGEATNGAPEPVGATR